jgi:hypothetical protein
MLVFTKKYITMLRQLSTIIWHMAIGLTFKIEATGGQWAAGEHGVVFYVLLLL